MVAPDATAAAVIPPPARQLHLARWLTLGVIVLGGGYGAVRALVGPRLPAIRVARQALTQRVVASGRVLPPARVSLGSVTLGTVARVFVEEGQRVKAGDPVVELEDAEARAQVAQAEAGVDQAAARLDQVRDVGQVVSDQAVRQAEVNLKLAEQSHRRAQTLRQRDAISAADHDETARALEVARSQAASARAQQRGTARGGGDRRATAATLAQTRATLELARARLRQLRITASVDGIVLSRAVEPGDVVQPGRPLVVLAKDGDTQLVVEPDEKNLAALAVGQRARAVADAFPDRPFDAVVLSLAPAVDPLRGTVAVKLRVPQPPPFLRPDMTVSVDVEVGRREGVLVVPAEALRDTSSDRPWVVRIRDGRTERRPVTLGGRGEGSIEITAGLAAGDLIASPAASLVASGGRVRPVVAPP
ncbi:MAG TPA: efflux RND transporter periplasmic adaptor subunit [Polyangia bacterium]|jgi:HlyD family secretion protein